MLRIGEFARLGNVSIRALRFYHEAGLLEPSYVDAATNYRSYELRQLRELQDIRLYKAMGLSLAEIREWLQKRPTPGERKEILRERRALLQRRIQDDLGCLARVEAQLQDTPIGDNPAGWRIELREIQPVWVAAARERLRSYEEADDLFAEIERRIRPELVTGKRAALWHTCANDGPQIDCEALRFLKRPASLTPGIRVYQIPATRMASLFHTGTDQTIPRVYQTLQAWLKKNKLVSRGPKWEIYWREPVQGNEEEALTEIRLPVL